MKPTLTAGIFRVLFRMVAASLPFFCISSCSVKEERSGCPCILNIYPDPSVEFTRYDKFGNTIRLVNEENGQVYSVKQFPKGSFTDEEQLNYAKISGDVFNISAQTNEIEKGRDGNWVWLIIKPLAGKNNMDEFLEYCTSFIPQVKERFLAL